MKKSNFSSKEILNLLKEVIIENEGCLECELDSLTEITPEYMQDKDSIFINASDRVLVIPYGYSLLPYNHPHYNKKGSKIRAMLHLDCCYLANDDKEKIDNKLKYYKELTSLLINNTDTNKSIAKIEKLELDSAEILDILEIASVEYTDDYSECELDSLGDKVSYEYMQDKDSIFINASDGVLVIPYENAVDWDNREVYQILQLHESYMASDEKDAIESKIKYYEDLISLLKN